MAIKTYRPTTQTLRYRTTIVNDDITTRHPHKPLIEKKPRTGGRRNSGDMTSWHRGGGHKRKLRIIDFKRDKTGIPATVTTIEYDPNRSPRIALLAYADGEKRYILVARRNEGWAESCQRAGSRHSGGQCVAAAQYSARHARFTIWN